MEGSCVVIHELWLTASLPLKKCMAAMFVLVITVPAGRKGKGLKFRARERNEARSIFTSAVLTSCWQFSPLATHIGKGVLGNVIPLQAPKCPGMICLL